MAGSLYAKQTGRSIAQTNMLAKFQTKTYRVHLKVNNRIDDMVAKWRFMRSKQAKYLPAIEQAFREVETKSRARFGGWSLAKSTIYHLCAYLLAKTTTPVMIELGSGQSTLFWDAFAHHARLPFRVITFEHNPKWAAYVSGLLVPQSQIEIITLPLWQIDAANKSRMFSAPDQAFAIWQTHKQDVPLADYDETRLPNAFYAITPDLVPPLHSVDAISVDGPNGSGRSLSYPLLFSALKKDALVLIDDFDHYPFVPELAQLYAFRMHAKRTYTPKHWVLLELQAAGKR